MLKLLISKEDFSKLPDALKEHYAEDGDNYILDSDDSTFKSRINEFRTNNISLAKEKEELQKRIKDFDGLDLEEVKEMKKRIQEIDDNEMIKKGDLEALVNTRVERMKKDMDGKYTALEKRALTAEQQQQQAMERLATVLIDSNVQSAVTTVGALRKGAMQDVLGRARSVFKVEDGEPVPYRDGKVLYGANGKDVMTIEEWAGSLLEDAPYLFKGNEGTGADGDLNGSKFTNKINKTDKKGFSNNLEKIASGEVEVI